MGDRAVVVGGSVAGLLAARVLVDGFRTVTVFDRDSLPDDREADPAPRAGTPQADHVHVMLEPGRVILEDLFPGYVEGLVAGGGLVVDSATELDYFHRGDFLAEGPERLPMCCGSRPLYEAVARRRLAARDDVSLRDGCHVTEYTVDRPESGDGVDVSGVRFVDGDGTERTLDAEVVVDATGRSSRTPDWLERHHYAPPVEEEVSVDLAYSTTFVDRPPGDRRLSLVAPTPPVGRGGTAVPVEGDRWVVTLFGLHGDHPPTDPDGFRAFADSLPTPALSRLLDGHEWRAGEIHHYPFPSSRRRRYEDLHRFPGGLLVTGDAVASFNPIYGQGMSVAALDALQLHHALAADDLDALASQFFDRVGEVVDIVWRMTVGADFEFPATEGPKPRGTDLFNRYVARVIETAHSDPHVSDAFARVLRLERRPTTLLSPGVAWRVLAPEKLRTALRSSGGERS